MTSNVSMNLVFLLEEESAKHFLNELLPRILPCDVSFDLIAHQGRRDLQKSIPRKLKAWQKPDSFFVILHDLDNNPNCLDLKSKLRSLCPQAMDNVPLIRIICRELEAWYFGDLNAVQKAFRGFNAGNYRNRSQYRDPDAIVKPSEILKRNVKGFSKNFAAMEIPKHMDINNNKSASFRNTIAGIKNLVETHMKCTEN